MENLSGVPPEVTLSGLSIGPGGLSGAVQPRTQGLSGTSYGTTPFGLPGGADLLSLLLQQAQGAPAEAGAGGGILQGVGSGAFGQQSGGVSAGSFGQTQPGYVAGQSSQGGAPGTSGSLDPVALLQKLLGLGKTGAQALAGNQQTPTGTSSPTTQATGGEQQAFTTGVASPVNTAGDLQQGAGVGALGGTSTLADPTLGNLFTTGALTGAAGGLDQNILASLFEDPALRQALTSGVTGGDLGELFTSQGGTGGFSLGGNTQLQDPTLGGGGGGLSGLPDVNFGNVASIIGAIQGLLGIIQGARSDSAAGVGGAAQSALGLTQALNALATGTETGGAILAASPALQAISQALSAASGPIAAAAPIIMAIVSALSNAEETAARRSGYANNPIAGQLYSNATEGLQQAQNVLGGLGQDLTQAQTPDLLRAITGGTNALLPYYGTAQGPAGAVKASDALTGMYGRPGLGGADQYTAQAQQAQQSLAGAIQEAMRRGVTYEQLGQLPVNPNWALQTLNAGGTPQDYYALRQGEYAPQASPILSQAGQYNRQVLGQQEADQMAAQGLNPATFGYQQDPNTGQWWKSPYGGLFTPENLLQAALGSSMSAPESVTHASGLASSMYGGPLWEAIARMGLPQFAGAGGLISQHFDPWATIRGFSPEQLYGAFDPIWQTYLMGRSGGAGGIGDAASSTGDAGISGAASGPGVSGTGDAF